MDQVGVVDWLDNLTLYVVCLYPILATTRNSELRPSFYWCQDEYHVVTWGGTITRDSQNTHPSIKLSPLYCLRYGWRRSEIFIFSMRNWREYVLKLSWFDNCLVKLKGIWKKGFNQYWQLPLQIFLCYWISFVWEHSLPATVEKYAFDFVVVTIVGDIIVDLCWMQFISFL